jgi:hypothetical protein
MNPYKEYYLATEESFTLSNTVGVSYEEWQISNKRINDAVEACEIAEADIGRQPNLVTRSRLHLHRIRER